MNINKFLLILSILFSIMLLLIAKIKHLLILIILYKFKYRKKIIRKINKLDKKNIENLKKRINL